MMQIPMPSGGDQQPLPAPPLPCPEEVRAQLSRIVTSPEFPSAGRGAAFLSYVIEEALAGRAQRIKGYSIAIEVFKRDEGFTQDDPVVRIEAGRLRRALERYYLIAGQQDPIRIDIPKGGYIPTFTWNSAIPSEPIEAEAEPPAEPSAPIAASWWQSRRPALAALVLVAGFAGAFYLTGGRAVSDPASSPADASGPAGPTLVIAPFANLGSGPDAELYALGLTEELLTALPRFKEIKVFGRETSKSLSPDVDVSRIRSEFGARYLLAGGIRASGSRIRVTARLLDTSDGEILWSQDYDNDLQSRDLFAIQSDVASKVATAIAQPYGIMAKVDAAKPPPDDLGAYACTLSFYSYRAELSVERHAAVRDCLEKAVARYPSFATAWAMLSIAYLDEDRFKFNPRPGQPLPMERSLQAARRAIQLDPGSTRALQALMTALFFNQQPEEALRIGEQALATNPNDTELLGEFGTRLAMGGEWARGAALLDQALDLNPGGGGFYHGTRALAAYMLHDDKTAVSEIRQADMQKFPLFHAVAAVIYVDAGLLDEARAEAVKFNDMQPSFVPNIVAELKSRNFQPADQARLIAALAKAGLPASDEASAAISLRTDAPSLQPQ